jgi:hypothetical protein
MTAYDADEAVRNARTYQEYARGYCLRWVRDACWELPGLYASSIEAWNGARHKHPDDRNPPKGAPCYYRGGRYGHIVITTTHDRIRSTDCLTAHDVSEVTVDWCERAWGYTYLGWSEDLNGVQLPLTDEEEEDDMPLNQEDKEWISNEIRKQVEESWRKVQDNDNSRGKNLNIAGKAGNVILNAGP